MPGSVRLINNIMNSLLQLPKFCRNPTLLSLRLTSCVFSKHIHNSLVQNRLLPTSTPCISLSRNFWDTFPFATRNMYVKDGLNSEDYKMVYRSMMSNYAFYGQIMSQAIFLIQLFGGLYYARASYIQDAVVPAIKVMGTIPVEYNYVSFMIMTVFTLQNFFIYYVAQNILLRVYHKTDTDEYILVSLNKINPSKTHLLHCKPGELEVLQVNEKLSILGNVKCRGRKYFLNHAYFKNAWHFHHLIGSDIDEEEGDE